MLPTPAYYERQLVDIQNAFYMKSSENKKLLSEIKIDLEKTATLLKKSSDTSSTEIDEFSIKVVPHTILENIFFYLDPDSLASTSLTCKDWNTIIQSAKFGKYIVNLYNPTYYQCLRHCKIEVDWIEVGKNVHRFAFSRQIINELNGDTNKLKRLVNIVKRDHYVIKVGIYVQIACWAVIATPLIFGALIKINNCFAYLHEQRILSIMKKNPAITRQEAEFIWKELAKDFISYD